MSQGDYATVHCRPRRHRGKENAPRLRLLWGYGPYKGDIDRPKRQVEPNTAAGPAPAGSAQVHPGVILVLEAGPPHAQQLEEIRDPHQAVTVEVGRTRRRRAPGRQELEEVDDPDVAVAVEVPRADQQE